MFITEKEAAALKVFVVSIPEAYELGKALTRRNVNLAVEVAQIGYEIGELGYELFLAEHMEEAWTWIKEVAIFVWATITSQEAIEFYCTIHSTVEKLLSKVVSAVKVYCAYSCEEKAALRMRVHSQSDSGCGSLGGSIDLLAQESRDESPGSSSI